MCSALCDITRRELWKSPLLCRGPSGTFVIWHNRVQWWLRAGQSFPHIFRNWRHHNLSGNLYFYRGARELRDRCPPTSGAPGGAKRSPPLVFSRSRGTPGLPVELADTSRLLFLVWAVINMAAPFTWSGLVNGRDAFINAHFIILVWTRTCTSRVLWSSFICVTLYVSAGPALARLG